MAIDTTSETAIFERIVLPREARLSEEVAQFVLAFDFSPEDREEMQDLANRAKQGTLSPDEQHSIDNYERVGHYLAILQSKARQALRQSANSQS